MSITNKTMVTPSGNITVTKDSSNENYDVSRVNNNTEAFANAITALTGLLTISATDIKSAITNSVWNTSASGLVLVQRKMGHLVIISVSVINASTIPSSAATELVPSNTVAKPYAAQRWSLVTQRGNTCIVTVTAEGGITVQGYPEDIPATQQANFLRGNLMYFTAD